MDFDEFDGPKKDGFKIGADLSNYSVEELEALAKELNDEISRINAAIERKKSELESAHSIFKS